MPLLGWKSRWNRGSDQTYMLVAAKEDKPLEHIVTQKNALDGRDDEVKRLRFRVRLFIGLWTITTAGLLVLFFIRSPNSQKPLLKTPVPSCKEPPSHRMLPSR